MSKAFVFKVVVIGEPGVGKTSLINRFAEAKFKTEYKPTLGANIVIKDVALENNSIKLLIFDIAGQKKLSEVRQLYYKGAQGAIIVYDVTRHNTYNAVSEWCSELTNNVGEVPRILIANKVDLGDARKVDSDDGNDLAQKLNCYFFETSAKTGRRVLDAFHNMATELLKRI